MNLRKLFLTLAALAGLTGSVLAQTQNTEATIQRVTGQATVTTADGLTVPLTAGMKVAQGATITTGVDGDVYLESHQGYVTSIKHDSVVGVDEISVKTENGKVTAEVTLLDLKSGNLVAKLDPSKKAVNQYAVRTPKGVAAAHGTVFTMSYKGATVTIAVLNGVVSVVAPGLFDANFGAGGDRRAIGAATGDDKNRRTVTAGSVLKNDTATFDNSLGTSVRTLDKYAAYDKTEALGEANSIRELMALAVATVAVAAQNGIGGTTAAEAADVAKAVFAAVPSAAAETAALLKTSGVTNTEVTTAISNQVPASEKSNFSSSLESGTFTKTTGVTTTTNTDGTKTREATTTVTTPQPIDPATVSRSG